MSDLAEQRAITEIALAAVADRGFVLAGAGAIREHGLIDRPTEDVDLFTVVVDADVLASSARSVVEALRGAGYAAELSMSAQLFARISVAGARTVVTVDMGVDWRRDPPAELEVGPVLSRADAIANKVLAVYGRMEARDYLDLDAIRRSGVMSDAELLESARERDPGFDVDVFAGLLARVETLSPLEVAAYGVTGEALADVSKRLASWARELGAGSPHGE